MLRLTCLSTSSSFTKPLPDSSRRSWGPQLARKIYSGKSVALPAVRRSNDLATNPESLAEFGRQERFMADQMLREMNAFQRQMHQDFEHTWERAGQLSQRMQQQGEMQHGDGWQGCSWERSFQNGGVGTDSGLSWQRKSPPSSCRPADEMHRLQCSQLCRRSGRVEAVQLLSSDAKFAQVQWRSMPSATPHTASPRAAPSIPPPYPLLLRTHPYPYTRAPETKPHI